MLHKWLKICTVWMVVWLATIDAMGATRYIRSLDSVLLKNEKGQIVDVFPEGTYFMCKGEAKASYRVKKVLEEGDWKRRPALMEEKGIDVSEVVRQARLKGSARFILISKSDFLLDVYEFDGKHESKQFETKVGLGMDRCLPPEEGGRCYYTKPGIYHIRWKIHDPKGIKWCIPKYMQNEPRYAEDLESGEHCFRGKLGEYALNIGASYAIHGTSDLESLGAKSSHGCIRVALEPMQTLFSLMHKRDMVYIVP